VQRHLVFIIASTERLSLENQDPSKRCTESEPNEIEYASRILFMRWGRIDRPLFWFGPYHVTLVWDKNRWKNLQEHFSCSRVTIPVTWTAVLMQLAGEKSKAEKNFPQPWTRVGSLYICQEVRKKNRQSKNSWKIQDVIFSRGASSNAAVPLFPKHSLTSLERGVVTCHFLVTSLV